jgi:hypothetical protein
MDCCSGRPLTLLVPGSYIQLVSPTENQVSLLHVYHKCLSTKVRDIIIIISFLSSTSTQLSTFAFICILSVYIKELWQMASWFDNQLDPPTLFTLIFQSIGCITLMFARLSSITSEGKSPCAAAPCCSLCILSLCPHHQPN